MPATSKGRQQNKQYQYILLGLVIASTTALYIESSTIYQIIVDGPATRYLNSSSVLSTSQPVSLSSARTLCSVHPVKRTQITRPLIAPAKEYLCSRSRLGNKLFLLAATVSTATTHNMTFKWVRPVANCKWILKLKKAFVNLAKAPTVSFTYMTRWKQADEGGEKNIFSVIPISPTNENLAVGGFRQSWKYFSTPAKQQAVRKLFTFSTYYEEHVQKVFKTIYSIYSHIKNPILVGVHMRLGDLLTITNGKRVADKPFYDKVLKAVKSHFNGSNNLIFVASSDSPDVGKQKLKDAKKLYNIYWLSGTDLEDFATLSKCNHSITSGGTFGFWTSWLAGGETFFNANVSIAGSSFDERYISDNFYLPNWIPVSWI